MKTTWGNVSTVVLLVEYTTQQVVVVTLVSCECCHDIGSHGDGSDEGSGEERERVKWSQQQQDHNHKHS